MFVCVWGLWGFGLCRPIATPPYSVWVCLCVCFLREEVVAVLALTHIFGYFCPVVLPPPLRFCRGADFLLGGSEVVIDRSREKTVLGAKYYYNSVMFIRGSCVCVSLCVYASNPIVGLCCVVLRCVTLCSIVLCCAGGVISLQVCLLVP